MIDNDLPSYIFIRLSIAGVRLITPLSIGSLLSSVYCGRLVLPLPLTLYAICESAFYLGVYLPRSWRLQRVRLLKLSRRHTFLIWMGSLEASRDPASQAYAF